jgi:hypothetical protein
MAATTELVTRDILCNCGHWLAQISVNPGRRQVLRLGRCTECHRRRLPSTPIVFVREDGAYSVVCWHGRIDPARLPWPDGGWVPLTGLGKQVFTIP